MQSFTYSFSKSCYPPAYFSVYINKAVLFNNYIYLSKNIFQNQLILSLLIACMSLMLHIVIVKH